jgi:hypothetical protein
MNRSRSRSRSSRRPNITSRMRYLGTSPLMEDDFVVNPQSIVRPQPSTRPQSLMHRIINSVRQFRQQRNDAQIARINAYMDEPMDDRYHNVVQPSSSPHMDGSLNFVPGFIPQGYRSLTSVPRPLGVLLLPPPEGYEGPTDCIETKHTEEECPICFCKIIHPDCIRCTNNHRIHYSCYVKWFTTMTNANQPVTCPQCRINNFEHCSPIIEDPVIKNKTIRAKNIGNKRGRITISGSPSSGGRRRKTIKHRNKRM